MKKLIAALFAVTLSLSMIACGSSADAVKADVTPEAPAAAAEEAPAVAEEAPKKSLKKDEGNRMERPTDDE